MTISEEIKVKLGDNMPLETRFGQFQARHFYAGAKEGVILSFDSTEGAIVVRLQSSCLFGESFGSDECDCAYQLGVALERISSGGILIYVYDEGRGAGLENKMKAMLLMQKEGLDTGEAYRRIGLNPESRTFQESVAVLSAILGSSQAIVLLTNNPAKAEALIESGFNVVRTERLICSPNVRVRSYLEEKARVLGHHLENDELVS